MEAEAKKEVEARQSGGRIEAKWSGVEVERKRIGGEVKVECKRGMNGGRSRTKVCRCIDTLTRVLNCLEIHAYLHLLPYSHSLKSF